MALQLTSEKERGTVDTPVIHVGANFSSAVDKRQTVVAEDYCGPWNHDPLPWKRGTSFHRAREIDMKKTPAVFEVSFTARMLVARVVDTVVYEFLEHFKHGKIRRVVNDRFTGLDIEKNPLLRPSGLEERGYHLMPQVGPVARAAKCTLRKV